MGLQSGLPASRSSCCLAAAVRVRVNGRLGLRVFPCSGLRVRDVDLRSHALLSLCVDRRSTDEDGGGGGVERSVFHRIAELIRALTNANSDGRFLLLPHGTLACLSQSHTVVRCGGWLHECRVGHVSVCVLICLY